MGGGYQEGKEFISFLACIEESISESEGKQFKEGLNSKVKIRHVQKGWEGSRI